MIGAGTGLPVILQNLKQLKADLTAIVTVADDGGSSGRIQKPLIPFHQRHPQYFGR